MTIFDFSREIEVGQINVNKSDNFSREIEVGQINVNKSDNFSREIEVWSVKIMRTKVENMFTSSFLNKVS